MRRTRQREVIKNILNQHKDHPRADSIYEEVRKELPNISLGTVYRNLEMMSEAGIIAKIENSGNIKRFDPDTSPHPHFRCEKCDSIEDIPSDFDYSFLSSEASQWAQGRKVRKVNIEFSGLCSECNSKENN